MHEMTGSLSKPYPPRRRPCERREASADELVQSFAVEFEYPVRFTRGLFATENPALAEVVTRREPDRRHRLMFVVDSGVASASPGLLGRIAAYMRDHQDRLELAAAPIVIEGGEAAKNDPEQPGRIQAAIHDARLDRQSCVVAIGGGAVLDCVGYAAATAHRGVRLVRVPTTVLAQNDSGVGVKNGINAFGAKNFVGTFAPPFAVINDFEFIATLPKRDRIAGIAEAVKVAAIRDRHFFAWLDDHAAELRAGQADAMRVMIRRGAELHLRHIATSGDPFETGSARPLDFGHWSAHKLETITAHALRHGEAVAIGMALDSRYAVEVGLLDPVALGRLCGLLTRLGFGIWHEALNWRGPFGAPLVFDGLAEFREHLGGELTITVLAAIGEGVEVHGVDAAAMARAIDWLRRRDRACA